MRPDLSLFKAESRKWTNLFPRKYPLYCDTNEYRFHGSGFMLCSVNADLEPVVLMWQAGSNLRWHDIGGAKLPGERITQCAFRHLDFCLSSINVKLSSHDLLFGLLPHDESRSFFNMACDYSVTIVPVAYFDIPSDSSFRWVRSFEYTSIPRAERLHVPLLTNFIKDGNRERITIHT